jgi:hypothetical protein
MKLQGAGSATEQVVIAALGWLKSRKRPFAVCVYYSSRVLRLLLIPEVPYED